MVAVSAPAEALRTTLLEAAVRGAVSGSGSAKVASSAAAALLRAACAASIGPSEGQVWLAVPQELARPLEHLALALALHGRVDGAVGHRHWFGEALAAVRAKLPPELRREVQGAKGNGDVARHAASGDHQLPRHADWSLIGRLAAALEVAAPPPKLAPAAAPVGCGAPSGPSTKASAGVARRLRQRRRRAGGKADAEAHGALGSDGVGSTASPELEDGLVECFLGD